MHDVLTAIKQLSLYHASLSMLAKLYTCVCVCMCVCARVCVCMCECGQGWVVNGGQGHTSAYHILRQLHQVHKPHTHMHAHTHVMHTLMHSHNTTTHPNMYILNLTNVKASYILVSSQKGNYYPFTKFELDPLRSSRHPNEGQTFCCMKYFMSLL